MPTGRSPSVVELASGEMSGGLWRWQLAAGYRSVWFLAKRVVQRPQEICNVPSLMRCIDRLFRGELLRSPSTRVRPRRDGRGTHRSEIQVAETNPERPFDGFPALRQRLKREYFSEGA